MLFKAFIQKAHLRWDAFKETIFEIINVLILLVTMIVYCAIQRFVVHHSAMELKLLMHDTNVEAMNRHDYDSDD